MRPTTDFVGYKEKLMQNPQFRQEYRELTPKLLTVEGLQEMTRRPVWFESRNGKVYTGWVLVYEVYTPSEGFKVVGTRIGLTQPCGHIMWVMLDQYNINWRCWTDEPTKADRDAIAWTPKETHDKE